jgi:hypothetical protein
MQRKPYGNLMTYIYVWRVFSTIQNYITGFVIEIISNLQKHLYLTLILINVSGLSWAELYVTLCYDRRSAGQSVLE